MCCLWTLAPPPTPTPLFCFSRRGNTPTLPGSMEVGLCSTGEITHAEEEFDRWRDHGNPNLVISSLSSVDMKSSFRCLLFRVIKRQGSLLPRPGSSIPSPTPHGDLDPLGGVGWCLLFSCFRDCPLCGSLQRFGCGLSTSPSAGLQTPGGAHSPVEIPRVLCSPSWRPPGWL